MHEGSYWAQRLWNQLVTHRPSIKDQAVCARRTLHAAPTCVLGSERLKCIRLTTSFCDKGPMHAKQPIKATLRALKACNADFKNI